MNKSKGVTIVGLLIGILILSIALAAQIRLLGNTVRREGDMRNLIMATSLAREGVELAFSWRVANGWEKMQSYLNQDLCPDIRDTDLTGLSSSNCSAYLYPVSYPDHSEFTAYLYGSQQDSSYSAPPFTRTVRIENCNDGDSADVCLVIKSNVSWPEDKSRSVEISKKIYNWYVP
jgi:hypothetical protein